MNELVYIVGNQGNMAKRYQAILNHLGVNHIGHDKDEPWHYAIDDVTHFLICTPTKRHLFDIGKVLPYGRPILCEKPLAHTYYAVLAADGEWAEKTDRITMVNQYAYINNVEGSGLAGDTYYNYFKTGNDGLFWDCLNIIGLADGSVRIENNSPIWSCAINGTSINLKQVDIAYCDMIEDWLHNPVSNWDYAMAAHKKVQTMEEMRCQKS